MSGERSPTVAARKRKGNRMKCASMLEYPREAPHTDPNGDTASGTSIVIHDPTNVTPTIRAMRLRINNVRTEDGRSTEAIEERRQVRTFLVNLPWRTTDNEEEGGITWVELYILYRLHGWNFDSESESFLTEKTPLKNMLRGFKHHVRWLAVHAVDTDQEWILHTSKTRANRLKTLGITNKHDCIKG